MWAKAGKYKLGARAGKHKLGDRAGKYKLGARAGKYKLGARTGGRGREPGPGPGAKQRAGGREIQRPLLPILIPNSFSHLLLESVLFEIVILRESLPDNRSLLNCVSCVPACQRGLRANMLGCQRGLRANVLACHCGLHTNVLACQRAKSVPTSHFYVPTCQ